MKGVLAASFRIFRGMSPQSVEGIVLIDPAMLINLMDAYLVCKAYLSEEPTLGISEHTQVEVQRKAPATIRHLWQVLSWDLAAACRQQERCTECGAQ